MRSQMIDTTARPWAAYPLLPGLALSFGLALAAVALQRTLGVAGLSPLVLAMVGGMALRNLGRVPFTAQPGIQFTLKRILRAAIVLLGFQLTLTQLAAVGGRGVAVIVVTLGATFVFTKAMGRVIGVERRLAELIAAGTSVCGASAVIACNTVTRGSDEDVAYAIACVTVFGSLSMLMFPALGGMLDLGATRYGLWAGATIHEVAQVVAAAFARGEAAGHAGTVAKLSRVMLLAPLILSLGALAARRGDATGARAPMPWFAFGFIAVVLLNSVIALPADWHARIATGTSFLLTMALAAMGLETDVRRLRLRGLRPLVLGALAWLFISVLGLGLVQIV
jgi:uncharacterized integral membrane protein (TIGR00698 family)